MQVEFYTTNDNAKTINKTLKLNKTINIVFRNNVSEQAPVMVMTKDNVLGSNYVHIPDFNRYYFIDSIDKYTANLVIVNLSTDLLMTYQNEIINNEVLITATEQPSYLSTSLPTTHNIISDKYISNVTLPTGKTKVLTTIGG